MLSCLALMVREKASDLFVLAGAPPMVKRDGALHPVNMPALTSDDTRAMAYSLMRRDQLAQFEATMECDLSYENEWGERFRVNVHRQRGKVGAVIRHVSAQIPTLAALGLPPVLANLAMVRGGLVLTVGAAGSGKTTTLASMLAHRNTQISGHILTIEDPIEYLHSHRRSLVTQREVGLDTQSYDEALRRAMREAPDVIMIGEIRDRTTMQHALHYAESGHLCVSTMHAANASQAIQRILNFFPEQAYRQVLMDLSLSLQAVVAQRLVRGVSGRLVPAVEVMLQSNFVSELIQKGDIDELRTAIQRSGEQGMCSFDQSLKALYTQGMISAEVAVAHADNRTDMALQIRLASGASLETGNLAIPETPADDS